MRPFILAVLLASPAAALPPQTESFLKELGIDSKAPGVVAVAADSVTAASGEVYTLDSLAAKRDEHAVKSFLVTRGFLFDFRNDHDSQFPDDEYYNILYLTIADRKFIAKTLMTNFPLVGDTKPTPEMKAETMDFLRSIGIDPKSTDVVSIYAEGPIVTDYNGDEETYSLDSMSAAKKRMGIPTFIATRLFIRRLKENFAGTSVPSRIQAIYLTPRERELFASKLAASRIHK